ncbi:MAG: PilZ domain-containing protein, partial [Nitrospira sp.]|nr:PilZ domain-containing protein [Nitrospira sp.]
MAKNSIVAGTKQSKLRSIKKESCEEQRQQPRFTSHFRSTFSGGQLEGQGRTMDLSAGGCMIETDFPVVEGT